MEGRVLRVEVMEGKEALDGSGIFQPGLSEVW